jgi:hypothetical protein
MSGISGFFTVAKKYVIKLMRMRYVEIFFDLSVFINILIFALEGFFENKAFD